MNRVGARSCDSRSPGAVLVALAGYRTGPFFWGWSRSASLGAFPWLPRLFTFRSPALPVPEGIAAKLEIVRRDGAGGKGAGVRAAVNGVNICGIDDFVAEVDRIFHGRSQ